ncbi:hypothetical protein, partial [Roseisolibacter sp. H3M3-2]|uniref:WD40/YVTN/BNR-like repeat-containing protein n=1 Tax=Roseisolibacter sp. H3M3-2 TaxID=3031323 RepID=UPI0023DA0F84
AADAEAARGASLRGVRAVSARVARASRSRGTRLRTTDGGATWARLAVAGADSLDFRSLWAFDSLTAVVASAGEAAEGQARVYRTADGGRTWALAHRDTTRGVFYDAVAFWDATHGLILSDPVGGRFVTLATRDGGRSWTRTPREGMPDALEGEAAFAAGNAALAVAGRTHAWFVTGGSRGARVYRSETGGARWDAVRAPVQPAAASAGLFAAAFRAPDVGVVTGGDYARARDGNRQFARSADGGRTWIADETGGAPGYWSGLAHVPGSRGATFVAVGLAGTAVSRDDGRSWGVADTVGLHAVSVAPQGAAWAVGPRGLVLHAPSVR